MTEPYTKQFSAKPPEKLARDLTRIVNDIVTRCPYLQAPKNTAMVILLEHAAREYDAGHINLPQPVRSVQAENAALLARVAELESQLAQKVTQT